MIRQRARTGGVVLAMAAGLVCRLGLAPQAQTVAPPPAAPAAAPPGSAAEGKKIYKSYGCYGCHGFGGQGGVTGTRLSGNAITFPAFTRALRQPRDQMPPYTSKVVSEQEVADLYAFVRSFPKSPDANTIPMLKDPKDR